MSMFAMLWCISTLVMGGQLHTPCSIMPKRTFDEFNFWAVKSAAAAYRKDLGANPGRDSLDPLDGAWIAVTTMLSHAVDAPRARRAGLLRQSVILSKKATGRHLHGRRRASTRTSAEIVLGLVEDMEDAAALTLALTTLEMFAKASPKLKPIERGRVIAQAARIARKTGSLEIAEIRYRALARMATRLREPELRIRAWIGYAVLAHLRGNYPKVRYWATRAAKAAVREELPRLEALAHHCLMVVAGGLRDLDQALLQGWRAYELSVGDPTTEADMLVCLGQTLLHANDPHAARSGFAGALARTPPGRIALPALGGYALASGKLGDHDSVRWATSQVKQIGGIARYPYETAAALCECMLAAASVGDTTQAESLREAALAIAQSYGYHEIVYQSEPTLQAPPSALSRRAAAVADAVRRVQVETSLDRIGRRTVSV